MDTILKKLLDAEMSWRSPGYKLVTIFPENLLPHQKKYIALTGLVKKITKKDVPAVQANCTKQTVIQAVCFVHFAEMKKLINLLLQFVFLSLIITLEQGKLCITS